MKTPRPRFTTQEKLTILSEADQFGTAYDLSPKVFAWWQKDLNSSKSRQNSIKKGSDTQSIESLKAEAERLKKTIEELKAAKQGSVKKPSMDKAIANNKAEELYQLVASLIVQKIIKDCDAEVAAENIQDRELDAK